MKFEKVGQVANRLGVPQATLKRLVNEGHVPSVKLGRRRLVNIDEVRIAMYNLEGSVSPCSQQGGRDV